MRSLVSMCLVVMSSFIMMGCSSGGSPSLSEENILKALSGHELYTAEEDCDGNVTLTEFVLGDDTITINENGVEIASGIPFTVDGTEVIFGSGDEAQVSTVTEVKEDYVAFKGDNGDIKKFYYTPEGAFADPENTCEESTGSCTDLGEGTSDDGTYTYQKLGMCDLTDIGTFYRYGTEEYDGIERNFYIKYVVDGSDTVTRHFIETRVDDGSVLEDSTTTPPIEITSEGRVVVTRTYDDKVRVETYELINIYDDRWELTRGRIDHKNDGTTEVQNVPNVEELKTWYTVRPDAVPAEL